MINRISYTLLKMYPFGNSIGAQHCRYKIDSVVNLFGNPESSWKSQEENILEREV